MGYIVKRGKAWVAVVYLGREKQDSGRTTERRLWRTVRGSRRDAERLLRTLEDRHERRELSTPRKETVAEYLRRWAMEIAPRSVGPTTCESYKLAIEKHWIPRLSAIRLDRLSPAHISSAIGDLLTRGRCHGKQVAGLSSGTVVRDYRVLHKALEDAVDAGDLLVNPASRRVKVPRRRRADTRTLTELQAIRFLDAARSSRLAALYELALTTGMRQGELLGLRWADLNLDLGVLAVRQVYSHGAFKVPKTEKSRRRVELDPHTADVLRRHKAQQDRERVTLGPDYRDQDLVFCHVDGRPLDGHSLTRNEFRRLLKHAKCPQIRFHDLRHSHATLLLAQGENPKVVSERLGHSGIGITMDLYSHAVPGLQREAAARLTGRLQALRDAPHAPVALTHEGAPSEVPVRDSVDDHQAGAAVH